MSVCKLRFGTPEALVPTAFSPKAHCPISEEAPDNLPPIRFSVSKRGCKLALTLDEQTEIYGFGLQLKSFRQNGTKKCIRPNADPRCDSGDTHAPVPFFVTTSGFGIYVDTARYATFYCGRTERPSPEQPTETAALPQMDLDRMFDHRPGSELLIEIPVAQGVDLYFITGERIVDIVSQYNLLSGGGCMPPLWGLGCFYRCDMKFNAEQILTMAHRFRELDIPCDIIGLEPGWQTHAYSCSYRWDGERFPQPDETVRALQADGFHVNLWEHAFTHPTASRYKQLIPYSGDTLVWGGLVPDFATEQARTLFTEQQLPLIEQGIDGFKLDECDGSDFTGGWSFPNCSEFPSGLDGEQYHSLFGLLYAKTMQQALGDKRTLSEVRNMGALAASYPFVLYSDLYGHKDFLTGVVNASFSGLLWSPEVRHAENAEDLLRRIQSVIFSPQALVNAFYLSEMPWEQHGCTEQVRELFRLRMSLLPYLYTAFYDYKQDGKPPIRALVCDYEAEPEARSCGDEWLFGDSMLVAPLTYPEKERTVWLPSGVWYDFFTGKRFTGGTYTVQTDGIPVYVKEGTLLPLASPLPHIQKDTCFAITLRAYGDCKHAVCRLIEDDGETYQTAYRVLSLTLQDCQTDSFRYRVQGIEQI